MLKRAADLAEALYAMPRGGLGGRADLGGRAEGYNYSQLTALPHDTHYTSTGEAVEDYNRQNSSPRYTPKFSSNVKLISFSVFHGLAQESSFPPSVRHFK